jgi:hypothetical protein
LFDRSFGMVLSVDEILGVWKRTGSRASAAATAAADS